MADAHAVTDVITAGLSGPAPTIRTITTRDLTDSLKRGYADFMAMPSHLVFVGLIYPVIGFVLGAAAFGYDLMPLLFPLASGFALIGPLAGIGLYELSRRREAGIEVSWTDAFAVRRSPAIASIIGMGLVLVAIFLLWILTANAIFGLTMGARPPGSYGALLHEILTTRHGWALIVLGNVAGAAFAVLVLTISVVAFPYILDRNAGIAAAIDTSRRAVLANPRAMATWGAMVAGLLALGSIPVFVGLAIVMPVLGHATWHLYRAVVAK